jgi:hypothetical protein
LISRQRGLFPDDPSVKKGDVRHESLLHPTSIALEVGDHVDGLWMRWEGITGSHLLLEDIIAGLTASDGTQGWCMLAVALESELVKQSQRLVWCMNAFNVTMRRTESQLSSFERTHQAREEGACVSRPIPSLETKTRS